MFKKKVVTLGIAALAALGGLVGCNKAEETDQEFTQASVQSEDFAMYIVGSHFNSWNEKTVGEAQKFVKEKNSDLRVYTVDTTTYTDWWGFKFISSNSWSSQFGMEDVDYENCNQAFKDELKLFDSTITDYTSYKTKFHEGTGNRSNVSLYDAKRPQVGKGTYVIKYNPLNFDSFDENGTTYLHKFVIEFTKAA